MVSSSCGTCEGEQLHFVRLTWHDLYSTRTAVVAYGDLCNASQAGCIVGGDATFGAHRS